LDRDSLSRYSRRIWTLVEATPGAVAEQLLLKARIRSNLPILLLAPDAPAARR